MISQRSKNPSLCQKTRYKRGWPRQCSRKPVRGGFCTQHHPDSEAKRNEARRKRWAEESQRLCDRLAADRERQRRADCFDELVTMLREAANQICYMHDKFQVTGTGNCTLTRINDLLEKVVK